MSYAWRHLGTRLKSGLRSLFVSVERSHELLVDPLGPPYPPETWRDAFGYVPDPLTQDAWRRTLRLPPDLAVAHLRAGLPGAVSVEILPAGVAQLELRLVGTDGGREIFRAERTFEPELARHDWFVVAESHRGQGIAKTLLGNAVGLYRAAGVDRIATDAGLDNGAYTWARHGFLPDAATWGRLRGEVAARLEALREAHAAAGRPDPVPDAVGRVLGAALTGDDPRGLWLVSDVKATVAPEPTDGAQPVSLAKHLLAGLRWSGSLDLNDRDQSARLMAYVPDTRPRLEAALATRRAAGAPVPRPAVAGPRPG